MTLHQQPAASGRHPGNGVGNGAGPLSVFIAGDDAKRRELLKAVLPPTSTRVVKESTLPPSPEQLAPLLDPYSDVLIVDLGSKPHAALEIVRAACALQPTRTVMVAYGAADSQLLVQAMHSGAREFLADPLSPQTLAEPFERAKAQREVVTRQKKAAGRCFVFAGAKGGAGVTTVAANFAVALAEETAQAVALVDLDLGLGDAALELGVANEFSTLDALKSEERMDSELLSRLMAPHKSGVNVLAAPDQYTGFEPSASAVMKLVNILRFDYPWLVVDAGTHFGAYGQSLFEIAESIYLVTQISVPDLRNASRFISAFFSGNTGKVQVVLNRYQNRAAEIDEDSIARALNVAPAWKIPNDYDVVHSAENAATPVVEKNGPITRVIRQMARAACGKTQEKRRFSLFG